MSNGITKVRASMVMSLPRKKINDPLHLTINVTDP